MYVCSYMCKIESSYVGVCVCTCICICAYVCMLIYVFIRVELGFAHEDIILANFNQLYKIEPKVCMYVCMYAYICVYTCRLWDR